MSFDAAMRGTQYYGQGDSPLLGYHRVGWLRHSAMSGLPAFDF
jgi:hypothetical protein